MGAPSFSMIDLGVTSGFYPNLPWAQAASSPPTYSFQWLACDHDSLSHCMDVVFQC